MILELFLGKVCRFETSLSFMELLFSKINDLYLIIYPLSNTFQDMVVISDVILSWLRNDLCLEKLLHRFICHPFKLAAKQCCTLLSGNYLQK